MSGQWTKTVLRSVRLPKQLEEILSKDAKAKGLSVNALVSTILTKYAEWDRFAEKFGFVTITRTGFRAIHDALDKDTLVKLAVELGSQNPREMTLFWFKKLNFETFLSYLNLICRYGRVGEYELEMDGKNCTILFHHGLGFNVSHYIGHFLTEAVRAIVHVVPTTEVGRNSLVLKFERP